MRVCGVYKNGTQEEIDTALRLLKLVYPEAEISCVSTLDYPFPPPEVTILFGVTKTDAYSGSIFESLPLKQLINLPENKEARKNTLARLREWAALQNITLSMNTLEETIKLYEGQLSSLTGLSLDFVTDDNLTVNIPNDFTHQQLAMMLAVGKHLGAVRVIIEKKGK